MVDKECEHAHYFGYLFKLIGYSTLRLRICSAVSFTLFRQNDSY